jgi:hypothetical protein
MLDDCGATKYKNENSVVALININHFEISMMDCARMLEIVPCW